MTEVSASPLDNQSSPSVARQESLNHGTTNVDSPNDHSATQPKQPAPPAANGLNARSCVTCRKRKVKCDKRHPCSNCNKAAIECVFPGPGRAPRRSRKPPDTELLARLRRLEGVVQNLGRGADDEEEEEEEETPTETAPPPGQSEPLNKEVKREVYGPNTKCGKIMAMHEPGKAEKNTNGITKEFGRLVVDHQRSRYVSNKFWTSLSEEVAELQDILDDPTDEEDDYPSPESAASNPAPSQGFLFGFSSTILSLRNFHPPTEQLCDYWSLYKSIIAPVMRLLHTGTTEILVCEAAKDLDNVSKSVETLLFSIYFAVVTASSEEDCMTLLGLERAAALRKYRFAVEQAFARANFINTQDVMVLQAMLLFLTAVRRTDDSRFVWTMTGLLIRIATSLGIHRDGVQFNLPPYETEIRRRLWWQICIMDVRASEDQGCEPSISEASFDTKFPLNINDSEISPHSETTPEEHEGATEMTFDLIRFSVTTTVRKLSYVSPSPNPINTKSVTISQDHKEHIIEEMHQYMERKFLRYLDMSNPLHWVAATVARLIMAKMWLVVHHPLQRSDGGLGLPEETKLRLFQTSVEVIEFSRLLETEKATMKWGWLFRSYVQWHALAFVLSQLCVRTEGPYVDRAWLVAEGVFDQWGGKMNNSKRGMMWKPLCKLMIRARAARAKALQQRALFPLDGRLGPALTTPLITQPGPEMNGSSANDYFTMPESFPTPSGNVESNVTNGNVNGNVSIPEYLSNFNDMNDFINPGDLMAFNKAGLSTTQQLNNGNNNNNNNNTINSSNGVLDDNNNTTLNGMDNLTTNSLSNAWQYLNMNMPGVSTYPITGAGALGNDTLHPDALMTNGNDLGGWDDMVREFQMGGGQDMAWNGVEI